jgi:hypothetical protein
MYIRLHYMYIRLRYIRLHYLMYIVHIGMGRYRPFVNQKSEWMK